MAVAMVPGMIDKIMKKERLNVPTTLQVFDIVKSGEHWECRWSDGSRDIAGVMGKASVDKIKESEVEDGGIVVINTFCGNIVDQTEKLMAFTLDVISKTAPVKAEVKEEPVAAEVKQEPVAVKMEGIAENEPAQQPATGKKPKLEGTSSNLNGKENVAPYQTPATKKLIKSANTPGFTPPSTGRKTIQPIQALNPYNNLWTIKARVSSKAPMRSLQRNGQPYSLFSMTLVDEEGSEIEATLWRDLADQWFDRIEEGKVYMISKGRVKPANRTFSTTRNDYVIDLSLETLIEQCADEDASKMQVKLNYVALDQLQPFVGKKMTVDIMAVVKEVHALGSVKRKSDNVDLARRDLTIVDHSGKMVRLTTWNSLAEDKTAEIEKSENPVVSFTAIRVGDYDGISLSTVSRSQITLDPKGTVAEDLKAWWQAQGSSMEFVPAGAGLASARKSGEARKDERVWLKDIVKDQMALPSPDAKAEFSNVRCCLMNIDAEQTPFFYAADAATGKKVIEDGEGWRSAADDKPCNAMEWRYFVRAVVMDATGQADILLNNDQAGKLFGKSAEDMRTLRQEQAEQFQAAVAAAKFTDWSFTMKSHTHEYKGELRQRFSATGQFTQDFVAESKLLINSIQGQQV